MLDNRKAIWQDTGYNKMRIPREDNSLHAVTHMHGKSTIMDTAPNLKVRSPFVSSMRASFESPQKLVKPVFRTRMQSSEQFDPELQQTKNKQMHSSSGFTCNSTLFDGTGWVPEKNLHGDQFRTLYRNQFNQAKPFHKMIVKPNAGRMRKRELVYDIGH